jgi:hypothetical protein
MVNTELRREYLENEKRGKKNTSEYPKNVFLNNFFIYPIKIYLIKKITIGNFNYFLWAPTLCYEPSYPRSPHGIRKLYLLKKLFYMFGCLVK